MGWYVYFFSHHSHRKYYQPWSLLWFMDFSQFKDIPVIDCHVHLWMLKESMEESAQTKQVEALEEILRETGMEQMFIFSGWSFPELRFKMLHPGHYYAGAYVPWSNRTNEFKVKNWDEYIHEVKSKGFDGVGEMGSKTALRHEHTPLDSEYYRGFWKACEDHDFPVLCHIGDVEDFWYEDKTPDWAKKRGWGYYNGDYPKMDELWAEIEKVLSSHPDLKISLCHFLFMSPDLEKASEFLDKYPNATLDLSLGVELMYNISRRRDDYRDFFKTHDDRIIFGTDIGMSKSLPEHQARVHMIRRFLETSDEFHTPDEADELLTRYKLHYIGLDLPDSSLRKIYSGNFKRLWGKKPSPVQS